MNKDMTTPLLIISIVFDYFGIPLEIRDNKSRLSEKVTACQYAMYFLRKYTNLSQLSIGRMFHKDHATVIHACKKVEFQSRLYKDIHQDIEKLDSMINAKVTIDDYKYALYDTDNI